MSIGYFTKATVQSQQCYGAGTTREHQILGKLMGYHTLNSGTILLVFGYKLAKESDLILEIVDDETEQAAQLGAESVRATDNIVSFKRIVDDFCIVIDGARRR